MDKLKKQIIASLLLDSRLYQALPEKVRVAFLSKLSNSYPSLFLYKWDEGNEETVLGYEAAWAGAAKQFK
ncbi:MAG TPA: hypothetical protein VL087_03830 [Nitrospirota bacterium]|nr:hypothetical protein [Nitrospirota bacterium]